MSREDAIGNLAALALLVLLALIFVYMLMPFAEYTNNAN